MWMVLLGGLASAADMNLDLNGPARYHAEALIQAGTPVQLLASNNINARVVMIGAAFDLDCSGEMGTRDWKMLCELDNVGLQAAAFTPDKQDEVDTIMAEYMAFMEDAQVQVEMTTDGRIRMVDIEGIDKRDERMRYVHEYIRLIVRRGFAPMDIQLPRKNTAEVGDKWKRKTGSTTFEMFSRFGTAGGSLIKYEVADAAGGRVVVNHTGRGNIGVSSSGSTLTLGDGEMTATSTGLYNTVSNGYAYFEEGSSRWIYGEFSTSGTLNQAPTSGVNQFTQAAWIGRINDDGTVEGPEGPRVLE